MLLDSYYRQATQKKVCQDYVIHSDNTIVLCDGCSSSPNTDFGAKVLAHCLLNSTLLEGFSKARDIISSLNMPEESLDCTIIKAKILEEDIQVTFYGDGALWNNGLTKIEYTENAPYYLNYYFNKERQAGFNNLKQDRLVNGEKSDENCFSLPKTTTLIMSDGLFSFDRDIIPDLLDIKVPNGKFIQRRCNKITDEHWDDFSIGAII